MERQYLAKLAQMGSRTHQPSGWGSQPRAQRIIPGYRYASKRSILALLRKLNGSERRFPIPPVPPPKRHPYDQWSPDARALDLVGDKWTLLIIRDLAAGPRRFVELQRVLPGISTEQLRSRLNRMVADGLLTRQRYREVPPRVDYELTERSRELMPVLGALARWGYEWTWTGPRQGEDVNVGAIFRLAPGLLAPPPEARGTVDLVVAGDGDDRTFRLTAADGRVEITERPEGPADATATGTLDAWIGALGPDGGLGTLELDGKRGLAEALLEGFTAAANRAAQRAA
jgi:DNA-binding HxlR family transcriptional regulator